MTAPTDRQTPDTLEEFAAALLAAAGARPADAESVARHLVGADLAGHDGHGTALLPLYVRHAREGLVALQAKDAVLADAPAIRQVDAGGGWGAPAALRLVDAVAEKARRGGLAAGTLARAHDLGRIGAFGDRAAELGLAALLFVNVIDGDPVVAPYRGSDARFGTNPVCIAFPASGGRDAFLLDMATSRISPGRVREAKQRGAQLPPQSLIDHRGMPTTDPDALLGEGPRGALTPLGRHKGYGLAFATEFLAGILSRSGTIQPETPRRGGLVNGLFLVMIDPAAFGDPAWMEAEMAALTDHVLASPPMDWDTPVLFPGAPERAFTGKRRREGIPLDAATVEALNALAAELGVEARL